MKDSITQVVAKKKIKNVVIIVAWILIWEGLSRWIHNDIFLPGPWNVLRSFVHLMNTKDFWMSIVHTLLRIGLGFIIGFLSAVIIGSLSCKFHLLLDFLSPIISMIKTIPVASFIILLLVWVSSKYLSIYISLLVTFPIIYITMIEGFSNVDRRLLEMAQVFEVKSVTKIRYIYFSELLPFVKSSVKVAIGMCWKAGISGEIIGLPKYSIGEQLYISKLYLNISDLFAWTFLIVLICYLFEKIFFIFLHQIEKRLIS